MFVHLLFFITEQEMDDQRRWVEIIKPRQALLRFKIPYEGMESVEYLAGDLYLQPFTKRSSTEVRLQVSPPDETSGMYATTRYGVKEHEECMFFHNSVTRRQHILPPDAERPVKRPVSYDHMLAHAILSDWKERAMVDPDINHELQGAALDDHIRSMIRGLDMIYGKILGLKWSEQFSDLVNPCII